MLLICWFYLLIIVCIAISAKFGQDENLKLQVELLKLVEELLGGTSQMELLEVVEELPELVDPKMTCHNAVTTSKLLEVLTSQPQNY
jgi:hypothetical protein